MKDRQAKQKIIIIAVILAVFVVAAVILYVLFAPKAAQGSKLITVTVVDGQGEEQGYELRTDAEYLRQALEEVEGLLIEGTDDQYGLYVKAVNGVKADYEENGAYWAFYVNGEYCNYAVEEQPVYDGDAFAIKYETGME